MKLKSILLGLVLGTAAMSAQAQVANFSVTSTNLGNTNSSASGSVTLAGGSNATVTYQVTLQNVPAGVLTNTTLLDSMNGVVVPSLTNASAYAITQMQYSNFVANGGKLNLQTTNGDIVTNLTFTGGGGPGGTLTGVKFDKVVPKDGKKLSFKVSKGFKVKGKLFTSDNSLSTNPFTGVIYAFFKASSGTNGGTNANQTAPVTLVLKPKLPKGQVKKGLLAQFKTDPANRVGVGATAVDKGAAVQVIISASNSAGVFTITNNLTANKIK